MSALLAIIAIKELNIQVPQLIRYNPPFAVPAISVQKAHSNKFNVLLVFTNQALANHHVFNVKRASTVRQ